MVKPRYLTLWLVSFSCPLTKLLPELLGNSTICVFDMLTVIYCSANQLIFLNFHLQLKFQHYFCSSAVLMCCLQLMLLESLKMFLKISYIYENEIGTEQSTLGNPRIYLL